MQTVRPGTHHLFCKPDEAETVTKAGIILSDKAAEKPKTAVVINVGSAVTGYQPESRIIYKSYAEYPIKLDGVEYILVDEEDVLGAVVEV